MRNDDGSMAGPYVERCQCTPCSRPSCRRSPGSHTPPPWCNPSLNPNWIYRGWDLSWSFWKNHDIVTRIIMTSKYEELKYVHDPWSKHFGPPWSWNHDIVNGINVIQKYKESKDVNSSTLVHIGNDIKIQGIKRYQSKHLGPPAKRSLMSSCGKKWKAAGVVYLRTIGRWNTVVLYLTMGH